MTALGNAKSFTGGASQTVDMKSVFGVKNFGGQLGYNHTGFWIKNLSATAAEILWFRLDSTVAVVGADDTYPLMAGERVMVRAVDFISVIAASGTPAFVIMGDQSGIVYS